MGIEIAGVAKLGRRGGSVVELNPDEIDFVETSTEERGMGAEHVHVYQYTDNAGEAFIWEVSEYPVGVINFINHEKSEYTLIQDFNFFIRPEPDDEDEVDKDLAIKDMVDWFHENFQDPANRLPYESAEDGYQWIHGGPYDAREELGDNFAHQYPETLIDEAVEVIQRDGSWLWDNREEFEQDPEDLSDTDETLEGSNPVLDGRHSIEPIVEDVLTHIPKQEVGANVSFQNGVMMMATLSPERGNPNRHLLEAMHAELIEKSKATARLILPTDNQYPHLGEIVSKYVEAVEMPLDDVNYTSVFIKGGDLKADFESLKRSIQSDKFGEYPELSQKTSGAIQKLLNAHQTFIGLSNEGGILLDAQARASRSEVEERKYRDDIQNFAGALKDNPEFIDEDLADVVEQLASPHEDDPNRVSKLTLAGRYSRHILILTGTVATIGVAGGALVAGAVTASPALLAIGGLAGAAYKMTVEDAYKGSVAHKELTKLFTDGMDHFSEGDLKLFKRATKFIKNSWSAIDPIADVNALGEWFHDIHNSTSQPREINYNPDLLLKGSVLFKGDEKILDFLKSDNIVFIGDLIQKTEFELMEFKGFEEVRWGIKERLASIGLHLGMDLPNWPPENLVEDIRYWTPKLTIQDDDAP